MMVASRGNFMRLRTLRRFSALPLLVFMATQVSAQGDANGCPVTTAPEASFVPPDPYPANAAEDAFWYGTSDLWTQLPDTGIWSGLPRRDDGYSNKLFLWEQGYDWRKEPKPEIVLILRRLDAHAPLAVSQGGTNAILDGGASMLTGVTFPTEGCWELTAYHAGHTLTFVVSVQP